MWILFGLLAWFILSVPLALVLGLLMGAHKLHAEGMALPGVDQTHAECPVPIMIAPTGPQLEHMSSEPQLTS
jgi:hypothetical protein